MWTREKLKFDAKEFLRKNLANAIIVCLIFYLIGHFLGYNVSFSGGKQIFNKHIYNDTIDIEYDENYLDDEYFDDDFNIFDNAINNKNYNVFSINSHNGDLRLNFFGTTIVPYVSIFILFIITIAFFILKILIYNPLSIGLSSFFIRSYNEESKVNYLFSYFRSNSWFSLTGKLLLRDIYIILWSLLLLIPGIIKSYEYFYVDYILAENPEMSLNDAIALSREMTNGEKFDIFILNLSFIGWKIVSNLLFGLGYILLIPYIQATFARLYLVKKEKFNSTSNFENNNPSDYFNEIKD